MNSSTPLQITKSQILARITVQTYRITANQLPIPSSSPILLLNSNESTLTSPPKWLTRSTIKLKRIAIFTQIKNVRKLVRSIYLADLCVFARCFRINFRTFFWFCWEKTFFFVCGSTSISWTVISTTRQFTYVALIHVTNLDFSNKRRFFSFSLAYSAEAFLSKHSRHSTSIINRMGIKRFIYI